MQKKKIPPTKPTLHQPLSTENETLPLFPLTPTPPLIPQANVSLKNHPHNASSTTTISRDSDSSPPPAPPLLQANVTSQDPSGWDVQNYTPEISQDIITGPNHRMSHPIASLEPATDYEAKVAVENKFGWSEESELFHFYTRKGEGLRGSCSLRTF